jgi:hypothetical protein
MQALEALIFKCFVIFDTPQNKRLLSLGICMVGTDHAGPPAPIFSKI